MAVKSYLESEKLQPMNNEEMDLFIKVTLMDSNHPVDFTEETSVEMGLVGQIIYKRLVWLPPDQGPVQCTLGVAAMVAYLSKGVPGKAVMWAYTLNRMFKKKGKRITMEDLAWNFPVGFPTEEEYERLWDAQKGSQHGRKCDNMVDQPDTWYLEEAVNVESGSGEAVESNP